MTQAATGTVLSLLLATAFLAPALGAAQAHSAQPGPAAPEKVASSDAAVTSLLVEGDAARRARNWLEAERLYRTALAHQPDSRAALTRLADLLDGERQHTAAQILWKQALRLDPGDDRLAVALADSYLDDGNLQAAADLLKPWSSRQTADPDLLFDLGTALARQDRYEEAVPLFQRAAQASPVPGAAQLSLAKSLTTLMHYEQAKPLIERYLAAHPEDADGLLVAGNIDNGLRDWKAAETTLRKALELQPGSFDVLSLLGSVERQDGQTDAAILHLLGAERLRPDAKEVHFQLLRLYRAQGNLLSAKEEEEKLKQGEDAEVQQTQATVLGNAAADAVAAGRYPEAIGDYERVLSLVPNQARVHYDLALVYERTGDRAHEFELLEQAEREDPALAGPHSQKGYLLLTRGDLEGAEPELRRALELDPESVETLGNLGVLCAKTGRAAEAEHLLRLAVADDPAYSRGYVNLGLVLASENRLPEATEVLRAELSRDPQDRGAAAALQALPQRPADAAIVGK